MVYNFNQSKIKICFYLLGTKAGLLKPVQKMTGTENGEPYVPAMRRGYWMKILMTNHQLLGYAGTEVFTYTVAKLLTQKGHEVVVYSPFVGEIGKTFNEISVCVYDNAADLPDDFDLVHVHHNITAYEIRQRFPHLPIVYMAHGIKHPLEHLPATNLAVSFWVAGSDGIYAHMLNSGIPVEKIRLVRNPVDESNFFPGEPLPALPKKALMISNKVDERTENIIREACGSMGIKIQFIGSRFRAVPNEQIPGLIRQHDIVFSLGRGVIETMFCGRVPIVFDVEGGDGMVTPENFSEIIKHNFSSRRFKLQFTAGALAEEIGKYRPEYGAQLHDLALQEFSAGSQVERLINVYEHAIGKTVPELSAEDNKMIISICEMIDQTRRFGFHTRDLVVEELGGVKAYRLLSRLGKLRYMLIPKDSWVLRVLGGMRKKPMIS
jgi:hypothetical protein